MKKGVAKVKEIRKKRQKSFVLLTNWQDKRILLLSFLCAKIFPPKKMISLLSNKESFCGTLRAAAAAAAAADSILLNCSWMGGEGGWKGG